MKTVKVLIETYSDQDVEQIKFDWNGKHSNEFMDGNQKFRKEVWEVIQQSQAEPKPELLADLLEAETSFAKEAWGINTYVHEIAESMLIRGGVQYLETFWRCKLKSMDTYGELSCVKLPATLARTFKEYCESRTKEVGAQSKKSFWSDAEKFFEWKASE